MNKKGIFNIVEYITYIIFIIIGASFIAFVTFDYLNEKIDTTGLETFLLTKKLIYSESCLAFKDDLMVQKGVIDLEKLDTKRLLNCFTKTNLGYVITVKSFDGNIIKYASNLDLKQQLAMPVCKTIKQYKCRNRLDIVLYKDRDTIKTGYLNVEVINLVQ